MDKIKVFIKLHNGEAWWQEMSFKYPPMIGDTIRVQVSVPPGEGDLARSGSFPVNINTRLHIPGGDMVVWTDAPPMSRLTDAFLDMPQPLWNKVDLWA